LKLLKFREEKQKQKAEKKPLPRPSQQEVSAGGAMVAPALMRRTGAFREPTFSAKNDFALFAA
jgi:hypothetical protein